MRTQSQSPLAFGVGLMLGLGLASVAVWTITARRAARLRSNTTEETETTERASFIDGAHPPNAAELGAHPMEEATGTSGRLVSEAVDMSATSQRW